MAKPSVMASSRLFRALDQLSKNTWIDVVVYQAMIEHTKEHFAVPIANPGEGDVADEDVAAMIQLWLDPVLAIRNGKPQSIARMMADRDARIERIKQAMSNSAIPLARPGDAKLLDGPALHNPEES